MGIVKDNGHSRISLDMRRVLSGTKFVIPFAVMEWNDKDEEYEWVFAAHSLEEATEYVRTLLLKYPDVPIDWDIRANVEIALGDLL